MSTEKTEPTLALSKGPRRGLSRLVIPELQDKVNVELRDICNQFLGEEFPPEIKAIVEKLSDQSSDFIPNILCCAFDRLHQTLVMDEVAAFRPAISGAVMESLGDLMEPRDRSLSRKYDATIEEVQALTKQVDEVQAAVS